MKLLKAYLRMKRRAIFIKEDYLDKCEELRQSEKRLEKMYDRFNSSITHNTILAKEIDLVYSYLRKKELRQEEN